MTYVPVSSRNSRASEQLVEQDPNAPVINGAVVALVEDDLWRHVLRRSAEGPGLAAHAQVFAEPEVDLGKRQSSVFILTNICNLYVAVATNAIAGIITSKITNYLYTMNIHFNYL